MTPLELYGLAAAAYVGVTCYVVHYLHGQDRAAERRATELARIQTRAQRGMR